MSLPRFCAVIRELRDGGPGTLRELAAALDASATSMWHQLRVMEAEGIVRVVDVKNRIKTYELAPPDSPRLAPYFRKGRREAAATP